MSDSLRRSLFWCRGIAKIGARITRDGRSMRFKARAWRGHRSATRLGMSSFRPSSWRSPLGYSGGLRVVDRTINSAGVSYSEQRPCATLELPHLPLPKLGDQTLQRTQNTLSQNVRTQSVKLSKKRPGEDDARYCNRNSNAVARRQTIGAILRQSSKPSAPPRQQRRPFLRGRCSTNRPIDRLRAHASMKREEAG
jgi:hypothetical protein